MRERWWIPWLLAVMLIPIVGILVGYLIDTHC